MKTINLTRGKQAIIDDSDYEWASHFLKSGLDSYESYCTNGNLLKRTGRFSVLKQKPTGKIQWEIDDHGRSMKESRDLAPASGEGRA